CSAGSAPRGCCSRRRRCSTKSPTRRPSRWRISCGEVSAAARATRRSSRRSCPVPQPRPALRDEPMTSSRIPGGFTVVGQSVPRLDAIDKVTGRARYVSDMALPGMLEAVLLRSPHARARVVRLDLARARAVPGLRAVVESRDLDFCDPYFGPAYRDRPMLAVGEVRFEGEPVVAALAEDPMAAAEALDAVLVDYEELPAVTTLEAALAPGAPLVHPREPLAGHFADLSSLRPVPGTNSCHRFEFERGRGAAGFDEAAVVVEGTYRFPRVQHYSMEPHVAVAAWDDEGGLTVWAGTQNPYSVRVELAKMFGVPQSR